MRNLSSTNFIKKEQHYGLGYISKGIMEQDPEAPNPAKHVITERFKNPCNQVRALDPKSQQLILLALAVSSENEDEKNFYTLDANQRRCD